MDELQCIFCAIANREIPTELLFQDRDIFVIKDIKPKAPVHLLIIPVNHVVSLNSNDANSQSTLGRMFNVAAHMAYLHRINQTGYRLIINQGLDASQEIDHLHIHLLGGRQLSTAI